VPVVDTYLRFAAAHGVRGLTAAGVKAGFRAAFAAPLPPGAPRYVGDGAAFWRCVVAAATTSDEPALFAALFAHYARPDAWAVAPGAAAALRRLRAAGVRTAVVSNWDTRLRALLSDLSLTPLFDSIHVSAELGADKPSAVIFDAALSALRVAPHEALMVGDDMANDVRGAEGVGADALLWAGAGAQAEAEGVRSFAELAAHVLRDDGAAAIPRARRA
jgi:REG-2-like HAD superfamily hydrolase